MLNGEETSAADSRFSFYRVNLHQRYMRYYYDTKRENPTAMNADGIGASSIAVDSEGSIYVGGQYATGLPATP